MLGPGRRVRSLRPNRTDVTTTLSLQGLQDLPNFSRNFTSVELFAPGALSNPHVSVLRSEENPWRDYKSTKMANTTAVSLSTWMELEGHSLEPRC